MIACLRHVAGKAGLADAMVALTDAVAGFLRHEGPWETAVELHTAAAEAATTPRDRAVALNDLGISNRLLARSPSQRCRRHSTATSESRTSSGSPTQPRTSATPAISWATTTVPVTTSTRR